MVIGIGNEEFDDIASCHKVILHNFYVFSKNKAWNHSTNAIESRNRVLREMLRRHRGTPLPQREAMVAWALLFKSTDNLVAIRAQYERVLYTRSVT